MHDLAQIEAGNRRNVLQHADQLLVSNAAVLVTYEGLAAMEAKPHASAIDALSEGQTFVRAQVGRSARVLTRHSAQSVH